jgi:hypothetical protein
VSCAPDAAALFTLDVNARGAGTLTFVWRPDPRLTQLGATVRSGTMTFTGTRSQYATYSVALRGGSGQRLQGGMNDEITAPPSAGGVVGDQFDLVCQ